jgi:hypothetical protein
MMLLLQLPLIVAVAVDVDVADAAAWPSVRRRRSLEQGQTGCEWLGKSAKMQMTMTMMLPLMPLQACSRKKMKKMMMTSKLWQRLQHLRTGDMPAEAVVVAAAVGWPR